MWEQKLVLKVRKKREIVLWRPCEDQAFDANCSHCALHSRSFSLTRQRCILNWSTYLFMDEGPNFIERLLTQSERSPASLLFKNRLSSWTCTAFSPTALLLRLEMWCAMWDISRKHLCWVSQKQPKLFHHNICDKTFWGLIRGVKRIN